MEELRKEKFSPDYATKTPTTLLLPKPENGRFIKIPLEKDQPLMLLKKGFGYSAYQLHNGKIGEIANEAVRAKETKEDFEGFFNKIKEKEELSFLKNENWDDPNGQMVSPQTQLKSPQRSSTKEQNKHQSPKGPKESKGPREAFPILNNSLGSVEPELPEWDNKENNN